MEFLVWGLSSKQMLHAQCENSITIVKDQAATSDNKHDEPHTRKVLTNTHCKFLVGLGINHMSKKKHFLKWAV